MSIVDEELLAQDVDAVIDRSVVRLVRPGTEELVGSGFLIASDLLLTCNHVIASGFALEAMCGDQRTSVKAIVDVSRGLDLAIVQLLDAIGVPLAASGTRVYPPTLVGRAAVKPSTGIIGSSPFELALNGAVAVQYLKDGTILEAAIDLAGKGVAPGASGSPLVDRDARAAVAVVVGGNLSAGMEHVWAVPLQQAAMKWKALEDALLGNDQIRARYAMLLNARGAAVLFDVLSRQKRKSLAGEERFVARLDVPRAVLAGPLAEFEASDKLVMAVIGASNVGKSWALASFALKGAANHLRCLIEARTLIRSTPPLPDQVHSELSRALGSQFLHLSPETLLASAERMGPVLQQAGVSTTIVIDGLNEAPEQDFLVPWLRQAVAWCEEHGVKLVLSCREESWPRLFELLELDHAKFYHPTESEVSGNQAYRQCFRLTDFSDREAAQAAECYGVDVAMTGSHPLMYRLAGRLQGPDATAAGRFKVLRRFIDRQLAAVAQRLRLGTIEAEVLSAGMIALADALQPGDAGALPVGQAVQLVGSVALLDALVGEGLLSCSAGHVRFRHDQLADVLRTITPEMLRAFTHDYAACDPVAVSLAAVATLRFESEGQEQHFEAAVELLVDAIGGEHPSVLSNAVKIVRAIPRSRQAQIERICRRVAEIGDAGLDDAAACIAGAPLAIELRVELLLTLATRVSGMDESGWPVRMKDWMDPDRRRHFLWALHNDLIGTPQCYLFQLLQQHRDTVFPLLVRAMNDERRIEREATVASLCAGLLFMDAREHLAPIVSLLLDAEETHNSQQLLSTLIEAYPQACADLILAGTAQGLYGDVRIVALLEAQRCLADDLTEQAIRLAFVLLRPEKGRRYLATQLAQRIRQLEPDETEAWRFMCDHWNGGMSAGMIPDAEFQTALCWIAERGCDFADFVCGSHRGTPAQQVLLVEAIRAGIRACGKGSRLGWLIEYKLDWYADEPELQRPWLSLAEELALNGVVNLRSHFAARAFSIDAKPVWVRLRELLLDTLADDQEIVGFMRRVTPALPAAEWLAGVDLFRPRAADVVDKIVWRQMLTLSRRDAGRLLAKAQSLVAYWRSAKVSSGLAASVLARIDAGERLQELLEEEEEEEEN